MGKFEPVRIMRPNVETDENELQTVLVQKNFDLLAQSLNELISRVDSGVSESSKVTPTEEDQFYAFSSTSAETVNNNFVDLTVNTEVRKDSSYSHAMNSAEVTINNAGDHEIIFDAGFTLEPGDIVEVILFIDTGSGYMEMPGATAYCSVPN